MIFVADLGRSKNNRRKHFVRSSLRKCLDISNPSILGIFKFSPYLCLLEWFFSNLVGEEGPRIHTRGQGVKDLMTQGDKGLFSKGFISAFNILSISAMPFLSGPNSLFSIQSKSPANNICVSNSQTEP